MRRDAEEHKWIDRTTWRPTPKVVGPSPEVSRGAPARNFGGGLNIWLRRHSALRVEVRDHVNTDSYSNGWPGTHYVSFRIGMTFR